ncbi:MaoC family dehydratase [Kordiimonas marina]|uniref:MaoC family dehydratase n=1 Tax=Kordiimonas marina TaxID=2872312 RepID=UPI001FF21788|nr:MaoC family dehydratase [Kordiimonas marina]MCJ9429718.1 MaoC family dehydratase [Kordiimonas marina]
MAKTYYEDIDVGATEEFGAYEVTREELLDFAGKYDPQPFHLDEDAAKRSVFGSLCTSGWHTCAMTMRMLVDHMRETGFAGLGSPGIDNIRWKKPVFPGDVLSVRTKVAEKRESQSRPNLGLVKSDYDVKNQKGEVVMTMTTNVMVAKRPA